MTFYCSVFCVFVSEQPIRRKVRVTPVVYFAGASPFSAEVRSIYRLHSARFLRVGRTVIRMEHSHINRHVSLSTPSMRVLRSSSTEHTNTTSIARHYLCSFTRNL